MDVNGEDSRELQQHGCSMGWVSIQYKEDCV
jgi:hypothetical protein